MYPDATTFVLEVINFLVLLWLLHRFLYKPVQAVLDARVQADAKRSQAMADERKALEASAAELARESAALAARRDAAEQALQQAIQVERRQRLEALAKELESQRRKEQARIAEEGQRSQRQGEQALRARAAAFVAGYLQRLATPAVEDAVIALFLEDLAAQSDAARAALRYSCAEDGHVDLEVTTAFPAATDVRERVQQQLHALTGDAHVTVWRTDPALVAGICVQVPGHRLEASLRRGVEAFLAEAAE
jgi:F-type H+-transporting ATPase subunit b